MSWDQYFEYTNREITFARMSDKKCYYSESWGERQGRNGFTAEPIYMTSDSAYNLKPIK